MFKILTLNSISKYGLNEFPSADFTVANDVSAPDGILVRSASMLDMELGSGLLAVARAGAGYNNIPVARCSDAGIVVFNTPGANANAVKELTLAGLLLSSRKIAEGMSWVRTLRGTADLAAKVEKGKADFTGPELSGKRIGVVGLGAVGVLVANACDALGMNVVGYDPGLTVEAAWSLSRSVTRAVDLGGLLRGSDYVTLHIPLVDATRGIFNEEALDRMKRGSRLINFARGEIVNNAAVLRALQTGRLSRYVTDFPAEELLGAEGVLSLPHLGASTPEAEENCAVMAARQLRDYLENGNVKNSVNLPDCDSGPAQKGRVTVINRNVPNVVGPITTILANEGINIAHMLNRSRGDYAYNIIDIDNPCSKKALTGIAKIEGVIRVRLINGK
ncbi:MAG: phosphoglycerate dehydrogenase [Synergistaceae bacterium]|jgi:D-3-phosphoglycerate dehydrogenase|nr:phosphoglycerate dehydrogenase [Synergistaceae bacterium]